MLRRTGRSHQGSGQESRWQERLQQGSDPEVHPANVQSRRQHQTGSFICQVFLLFLGFIGLYSSVDYLLFESVVTRGVEVNDFIHNELLANLYQSGPQVAYYIDCVLCIIFYTVLFLMPNNSRRLASRATAQQTVDLVCVRASLRLLVMTWEPEQSIYIHNNSNEWMNEWMNDAGRSDGGVGRGGTQTLGDAAHVPRMQGGTAYHWWCEHAHWAPLLHRLWRMTGWMLSSLVAALIVVVHLLHSSRLRLGALGLLHVYLHGWLLLFCWVNSYTTLF